MPPSTSPVPSSPDSRPGTPADNNNAIPDSAPHEPDLPLTMASSIILSALPRDATTALSTAAEFPNPKVTVHFKAVGSAPELKKKLRQISSTQRFEAVVSYLRKTLKVGDTDSIFLYINSSFAPALDEIVGNLHRVRSYYSEERVHSWES
jgi:ubiquitin-like protein ATG12